MPRSRPRLNLTLVILSILCLACAASPPHVSLPTRARQICPIVLPTAAPTTAPSKSENDSLNHNTNFNDNNSTAATNTNTNTNTTTTTTSTTIPDSDLPLFAEPRVIGGSRAIPSIRSFLVSLSHPNDSFACTGSVIAARWVLTAAHCQVRPDWKLRVGSERPNDAEPIPIRRVIPHGGYVHGRIDSPGDLALVELAGAVPRGAASFVRLNVAPAHPEPGSFARTAGYGRVVPGRPPGDAFANQVDTPVNSPERCRRIYDGYLDIRARDFICVGYDRSRCRADSCHGDSGGPVLQYDATGRPVQIGVVSFGLKCGTEGIPSVGVRVSAFTRWIRAQGAPFAAARAVVAEFADGSDEAARDDTDVSVFQSDDVTRDDPRFMLIPKATFIIVCLIAGFAVAALVALSVSFLRSARSVARSDDGAAERRADGARAAEESRGTLPKVEDETTDEEEDVAAVAAVEAVANGGVANGMANGGGGGAPRLSLPLAYSLFQVPASMLLDEDDDSSSSLMTAPSSLPPTSGGKASNWTSLPSSLPRGYQVQLESGLPRLQVTFPGAAAAAATVAARARSGRSKSSEDET